MIVYVRSFIVSFLVLLQLVAPLIHAHKNDKFESSELAIFHFHLPDLEQINTVLGNGVMMTTLSIHEGEAVTVSTGKQEERKRQLLDDLKTIVILSLLFTTLFKPVIHKIIVRTKPLQPSRFFNLASPRGLPAGLTYATVGSKVTISGTPTVVGSFPIIIKADDITNSTSISASTAVDIADAPMIFSNFTFDAATVGTNYSYSFSALGGYGALTYSTVSPVPAGLSIAGNTLTGTPTVDGKFPIIMTVKDSLGFTQNAASSSLIVGKFKLKDPKSHEILGSESLA